MKKTIKTMVCGLLAATLTACQSGGIVEKPVVEMQEVPVDAPTAVEQALDEMDYPYIDETEYCLGLVQAYQKTEQWSAPLAAEAEADANSYDWDSANDFIEGQPTKTVFAEAVSGMLWQRYAEKVGDDDAIDRGTLEWIEAPDATCMTAQQAANCAGRLVRDFSPESEEEIHLLCVKLKNEIEKAERYYWIARIGEPEVENAPGKWLLSMDAVTGELHSYQNVSEAYNFDHESYQWAEAVEMVQEEDVKEQFQQILDALGNGLQCGSIRRQEMFMADVTSYLLYDVTVGEKIYQTTVFLDTKKIAGIERHYAVELTLRTKFCAPLNGELTALKGMSPWDTGVDYAAPKGAPVYAAIDGEVTMAQRNQHSYGNYVEITSDDGFIRTVYAYLSDIHVEMGQTVTAGQMIGTVGHTGNATGDCLHFDVRTCVELIDPTIINYVKP